MPPDFERKHHGSQLQVVSRVIIFMDLQLSRGVSYDFLALHQHATETLNRGVAIHNKIFNTLRERQNRCTTKLLL
ncbi:hypothetical protein HanHA300_Chr08g0283781 [Helianthus annuus]|nr:hypothetical protein HanHA300_Chr08g0283781 [Helianthus annuus]KAJ0547304.1 hypothetical protein HanIR_Chr08g0370681 [Helianthus annuus]